MSAIHKHYDQIGAKSQIIVHPSIIIQILLRIRLAELRLLESISVLSPHLYPTIYLVPENRIQERYRLIKYSDYNLHLFRKIVSTIFQVIPNGYWAKVICHVVEQPPVPRRWENGCSSRGIWNHLQIF